jgi:ubiquinol-cytochrome c reductase iron-sulfur subunit
MHPPLAKACVSLNVPPMSHTASTGPEPTRRDLLSLIAISGAAIGAGAIAWPLIDSMNPSADVIAAGAPIDIDLSKIAVGQQIVVLWRGAPMLIVNRTPAALKTLQEPTLISRLSDPNSTVHQQPPYAENWHRSVKPEYAVIVGICTHLGCLPGYMPTPDATSPAPNWPGVTARSMISPAACTRAFLPRIICRYRRIISSTTRRCALGRTPKAGRSN